MENCNNCSINLVQLVHLDEGDCLVTIKVCPVGDIDMDHQMATIALRRVVEEKCVKPYMDMAEEIGED